MFTRKITILVAMFLLLICLPVMVFAESENIQEIQVPNSPVRGMIQIEKQGPMLTGFDEHQDPFGYTVHTPLYSDGWLEGAVFEVYAVEDIVGREGTVWFRAGELADTITTVAGDTTESALLPLGHYYVTEVSAPAGYVFDDTRYDVVLESRDHVTPVVKVKVNASNDYMPARISLSKEREVLSVDTDDTGMVHTTIIRVPGEGFVFGLYNQDPINYKDGTLDADTLIATSYSDAEGNVVFTGKLPHGDYTVREMSVPEGWKISDSELSIHLSAEDRTEDNELVVRWDDTVVNELIHSDIRISKTDFTGSDYLPDTLIEIRNENGEIVLRDYTGEDGYLPAFPAVPGKYTYKEVLAPEGYELSVTELSFTVGPDGTVEGQTSVADDYTRFSVRKEDTNHLPLEGVVFGLFKEDGTQILEAKSDKNGLVTFEKVPYGNFYVLETTPLPGYLKDFTRIPVSVDGTFVNPDSPIAVLTNEQTEILLSKVDQNGAALAGAEFGLYDENGKLVMTAVSDAEGLVRFVGVEYGTYTIRELRAPAGYLLNHDEISIMLDENYTNSDQPFTTVVNREKKIMFIKVDTSGNPLEGVEFSLFNAATMEKVETVVSDPNGVFTFRNFDYGDWVIRETAAPEGFCKIKDIHLHVGDDWIEPEPIMCVDIPNHYEFMKTDSSGNPLPGVKFRLETEKGKDLGTYESGEDGMVYITDLKPGTYIIREIETLEGYSITGEVIKLKLDEYYVIPEELKHLVNYTTIQTGVHMAVTGIMWLGVALMIFSGTTTIIRKRRQSRMMSRK